MFIRKGSEQSYVITPNESFKHINKLYSWHQTMYNRLTDQIMGLRAVLQSRNSYLKAHS